MGAERVVGNGEGTLRGTIGLIFAAMRDHRSGRTGVEGVMPLIFLLTLQAAAAPAQRPGNPSDALPRIDFDLATQKPRADQCGEGAGAEIVVCGRRPGGGDYPYDEMAKVFREKPRIPKAEIGVVGNARASIYLEDVPMPNGMISKRIMVGVRVPF